MRTAGSGGSGASPCRPPGPAPARRLGADGRRHPMTRRAFGATALAAVILAAGLALAQGGEEGFAESVLTAAALELPAGAYEQAVVEVVRAPRARTAAQEQPVQHIASVLEGEPATAEGGVAPVRAAGSSVVVPRGAVVALANRGDAAARARCFIVVPEGALAGE